MVESPWGKQEDYKPEKVGEVGQVMEERLADEKMGYTT
jgi:hypothetical protein